MVVRLLGLQNFVAFLGHPFDAVLAAKKRFDLINILGIGNQVLQSVLVICVLRAGGGLLGMAWATLFTGMALAMGRYVFAVWCFPYFSVSLRCSTRRLLRGLLNFGIFSVVRGVAGRFSQASGTIIVGAILGPAVAAFYAIAEALVGRTGEVAAGVTNVFMPVASQLDGQKRHGDLIDAFLIVTGGLLAIAVTLFIVFVSLGQPLIDLWIGHGYGAEVYPTLCVLALAKIVDTPSDCGRNLLLGIARVGEVAAVSLIELAGVVLLGALLTVMAGIIGMALGLLLTECITAGILIPALACCALGMPLRRFFCKVLVSGVGTASLAVPTALAITASWPVVSLLGVAVQGLLDSPCSRIGCFWIGFDHKTRTTLLDAVWRRRSEARGTT